MVRSVRLFILLLLSAVFTSAAAQNVAILTPNNTDLDKSIALNTRAVFSDSFRVQDLGMSETALEASGERSNAFNLTTDAARNLAAVLGCDFFIVIKSGSQRRASIEKEDHSESFAAFFVVSGRTGRLIKWQLFSQIGGDAGDSEHRLTHSLSQTDLAKAIVAASKSETVETNSASPELVPDTDSQAAKSFRAPVPYRRMKPEYTRTAYLYDVSATVEATVDLDEKGQITRLEITRWAGYDLDESVGKAVRSMNWRPAERNGKPLPIRFLLRYNFKKLEKEDTEND